MTTPEFGFLMFLVWVVIVYFFEWWDKRGDK